MLLPSRKRSIGFCDWKFGEICATMLLACLGHRPGRPRRGYCGVPPGNSEEKSMIDKEVAELRRRYRQDRGNIQKIRGCYVNLKGEILTTFSESMGLLPVEEQEKYLEFLKKALSGSIGRTLTNIEFSTKQVVDSPEHKLLTALRDSALKDEEAVGSLYEKIAKSLNLGVNYLILLAYDCYDVPYKSKDGAFQQDAGDTQFSYILCSVCPVKETNPALHYDGVEKAFHNRGTDWVVAAPEVGFLFPAFDGRATNLYGALYYTRNSAMSYDELVDAVFHTQPPMAPKTQGENFREVLEDALQEECSVQVVDTVRSKLREMVQVHKEAKLPEPLEVSPEEVGSIVQASGVSQERMAAFRVKYESAFGVDSAIPPQNLLPPNQLEYRTPDVVIKVDPARQDLVETRVLGGVKYLLIKADEGVELNGVKVNIE